jgi:hypothetical protein
MTADRRAALVERVEQEMMDAIGAKFGDLDGVDRRAYRCIAVAAIDLIRAEVERLRAEVEKMRRSRDRYRKAWEDEKARAALAQEPTNDPV